MKGQRDKQRPSRSYQNVKSTEWGASTQLLLALIDLSLTRDSLIKHIDCALKRHR